MSLLAVDLGGTKLALALINTNGEIETKSTVSLSGRTGELVGELIASEIVPFLNTGKVEAIGMAVPGIYTPSNGTVWAPNIAGWDKYPLLEKLKTTAPGIPVTIDSDRACYISGEIWNGNAKGCTDAIFMAVGTGIGAGIISDGRIIHGAHDIAGAIGWMALTTPYTNMYDSCGCFEYHASGEGIKKVYIEMMKRAGSEVSNIHKISAHDIFQLQEDGDKIAHEVIAASIRYWGMAVANLVSIFNPQMIIFGGGVFGPARKFIPNIREEAVKWAQPISMKQVQLTASALGTDAGLVGAAYLALQKAPVKNSNDAG